MPGQGDIRIFQSAAVDMCRMTAGCGHEVLVMFTQCCSGLYMTMWLL